MADYKGLSKREYILKRLFDITMAVFLLLVFSPLFLIVSVIILIVMGTPILFRQKRPGYHARLFTIYKFRTMGFERGPDGKLLPDNQRTSKVGEIIRRLSLDELPELVNVLKGDMSLVGPRPLLIEYLDRYTREQSRRHNVLPGITGWAQINGRNAISWEEKLALDVWYVEHYSFLLDLRIIARTIKVIVTGEGIDHPPGQMGQAR